jgi:hypothetical protein
VNIFPSCHPLSTRPICPSSYLSNIFSLDISWKGEFLGGGSSYYIMRRWTIQMCTN